MNAQPRPVPTPDTRLAATVVTESGRRLDLTAPNPSAIQLADIAGALARLPVWGGHAGAGPWSFAAQALHAEGLAETRQNVDRAGRAVILLLHARLAYTGGPAEAFFAALEAVADAQFEPAKGHVIREAGKTLGLNLDRAIRTALGLPVLTAEQRARADDWHRRAEAAAWADLMPGPPPERLRFAAPQRLAPGRIAVQPWPDVAARFLDRARMLLGRVA